MEVSAGAALRQLSSTPRLSTTRDHPEAPFQELLIIRLIRRVERESDVSDPIQRITHLERFIDPVGRSKAITISFISVSLLASITLQILAGWPSSPSWRADLSAACRNCGSSTTLEPIPA